MVFLEWQMVNFWGCDFDFIFLAFVISFSVAFWGITLCSKACIFSYWLRVGGCWGVGFVYFLEMSYCTSVWACMV